MPKLRPQGGDGAALLQEIPLSAETSIGALSSTSTGMLALEVEVPPGSNRTEAAALGSRGDPDAAAGTNGAKTIKGNVPRDPIGDSEALVGPAAETSYKYEGPAGNGAGADVNPHEAEPTGMSGTRWFVVYVTRRFVCFLGLAAMRSGRCSASQRLRVK